MNLTLVILIKEKDSKNCNKILAKQLGVLAAHSTHF